MEPAAEHERQEEPREAEPPEVIWDRMAWMSDQLSPDDFEAVRAAPEQYVPLMLNSLRSVAAEPERYSEETRHHGHECALAWLAELEDKKAFPHILAFLRGIAGFEDELLAGDIITEDLPSLLSSTFDGDLDALTALVEDQTINEFVRSSALTAIALLVNLEQLSRAELSTRLGHLMERLPKEPSIVWDEVGTLILDFKFVEHRKALEVLLKDSSRRWRQTTCRRRSMKLDDQDEIEYDSVDDAERGDDAPAASRIARPFIREAPKVGRNDPCPCGSGKKHKRCCLGKESPTA